MRSGWLSCGPPVRRQKAPYFFDQMIPKLQSNRPNRVIELKPTTHQLKPTNDSDTDMWDCLGC